MKISNGLVCSYILNIVKINLIQAYLTDDISAFPLPAPP